MSQAKNVLMSLFIMSGLALTLGTKGQTANKNPGNKSDTTVSKLAQAKVDPLLAAVNDKEFLEQQEKLGLKLQEKYMSQLRNGDTAVTYIWDKQINGYDVQQLIILVHRKGSQDLEYTKKNTAYAHEIALNTTTGKSVAAVHNLNDANQLTTVCIDDNGDQGITAITLNQFTNGVTPGFAGDPGNAWGFTKQIVNGNRLVVGIKFPTYQTKPGQDNEPINISNVNNGASTGYTLTKN